GLAPGDEVALALPAGSRFAVSLHACLMAGLVAVPDDLRLPAERRAERTAGCAARLEPVAVEHAVRKALQRDVPAFAAGGSRPLAGSGADADTPAVRLTTSGTTGPGTPVLLSRGALLWNAIGSAVALGQPPEERWLSGMPVSHVGGLTVLIRSAIGCTTALLRSRFELEEQVSMLQFGEATITSVVPTTLGRLLDAGLDRPPNLRLVLLGGAPIPPELLERADAAGIAVASTYGLSEACSQVLTRGRPLFCTRVALRGEVEGADSARTTSGDGPDTSDELLVRGPTLALGTAGDDGWLATGDRGRRLPEGGFAVVGRIAETIVTGGENVAPTEVEAHLLAQPGVLDAAALGVDHPEWGEQVEARVVLAAGHTLDEPRLRESLRRLLPPFAVPKRITVVDALPRTPTGKLVRRELV
ncbi:MAG: AMP-binding protein, partial [Solirubrobacteraceae bacterium]|nr:AMP-binding protein [Solirubrobacteraceae bacterium]